MENFRVFGFKDIPNDILISINNNNYLTPLLYKYSGMGYYQILVKLKRRNKFRSKSLYKSYNNVITDKLYKIVIIGGSNGYDVVYNKSSYDNLTDKDKYYNINTLLETLKKNPNITFFD